MIPQDGAGVASQAKHHVGDVQPAEHTEERCRGLRDAHGEVQQPAQLDAVLARARCTFSLQCSGALVQGQQKDLWVKRAFPNFIQNTRALAAKRG